MSTIQPPFPGVGKVFAPAKVNLALHVTGKRPDGYHLLDSLVVFAGVFDWITVERAEVTSLEVMGPQAAGVPSDQRNIMWKTAEWAGRPARMQLEKHIPNAAGLGGGSSDAASVLIALGCGPDGSEVLGADVPVCWHRRPMRMRGIGEMLDEVPPLPPMWIVLVNAGVEVPTGAVFKAMDRVDHPAMPTPDWQDFDSFIEWLGTTRNDMEPVARRQAPVIGTVLERIRAIRGCQFARMSGSGGTCFGLFASEIAARDAALGLPTDWWIAHAPILDAAPAG